MSDIPNPGPGGISVEVDADSLPDAALAHILASMPQFVERVKTARRVLRELDQTLDSMLDGSYLVSPLRECLRCGHRWRAKTGIFPPKTCPRCSTTGWSTPPSRPGHRRPGDTVGAARKRNVEGVSSRRSRRSGSSPSSGPGPAAARARAHNAGAVADAVPPEEIIGMRRPQPDTPQPPLPPGMRQKSLAERLADAERAVPSPLPEIVSRNVEALSLEEDLGLGVDLDDASPDGPEPEPRPDPNEGEPDDDDPSET
jgi:hypothetical protein